MTKAQDQQSRAAYEDRKWYWVEHEGWGRAPSIIAPALYKGECDAWYSFEFSGISTRFLKVLEPCELQAARARPASENVREGEPYDNPAFEDLARTMGVWGTAQSALCAQFFLAGRGAVPACPYPCGWDGLHKITVGDDAYLARIEWPEDEEGVSVQRAVVMRTVTNLIEVCRAMLAAGRQPSAAQEPGLFKQFLQAAKDAGIERLDIKEPSHGQQT